MVFVEGNATKAITALCVDEIEVSAGALTNSTRCYANLAFGFCNSNVDACLILPANCMAPKQAERFCEERHKRLPTRAEWRWMVHNGIEATRYPWGNGSKPKSLCADSNCILRSSPDDRTHAGVRNLVSTVLEWVSDENGHYYGMGRLIGDDVDDAGIEDVGQNIVGLKPFGFRCVAEPGTKQ